MADIYEEELEQEGNGLWSDVASAAVAGAAAGSNANQATGSGFGTLIGAAAGAAAGAYHNFREHLNEAEDQADSDAQDTSDQMEDGIIVGEDTASAETESASDWMEGGIIVGEDALPYTGNNFGGTVTDAGKEGYNHYEGTLGTFDYNTEDWELQTKETEDPETGEVTSEPILKYIGDETDGSKIDIPEGLNSLNYSFEGNEELTSVPEIPDSVESAVCAFKGCSSLEFDEALDLDEAQTDGNVTILDEGKTVTVMSYEADEKPAEDFSFGYQDLDDDASMYAFADPEAFGDLPDGQAGFENSAGDRDLQTFPGMDDSSFYANDGMDDGSIYANAGMDDPLEPDSKEAPASGADSMGKDPEAPHETQMDAEPAEETETKSRGEQAMERFSGILQSVSGARSREADSETYSL